MNITVMLLIEITYFALPRCTVVLTLGLCTDILSSYDITSLYREVNITIILYNWDYLFSSLKKSPSDSIDIRSLYREVNITIILCNFKEICFVLIYIASFIFRANKHSWMIYYRSIMASRPLPTKIAYCFLKWLVLLNHMQLD